MLLPDPYKDDVLVEVDPNAFRAYNVTGGPGVPRQKQRQMVFREGTVSIDGARERARKGGNYKAGELYAIAEPDILSVIEERSKKYDWEGAFCARRFTRCAEPQAEFRFAHGGAGLHGLFCSHIHCP